MDTTTDVVVDELWNSTVAKIPNTNSTTGFERISLFLNISPADFPGKGNTTPLHVRMNRKK